MTIFYTDTFTASGGAGGPPPTINLSAHISDSGHGYATGTANVPKVDTDNNRLVSTAAGNVRQFWAASATPPSADYKVSLDVTTLSTVDFTLCGPGARVQGGSLNTGYFAIIDPNLDQLQIAKYVAGTETIIGTPYTIGLGALPETHKVTIEVSGSTVKAYLDDVERISVTDTAITSAGNPGGVLRINANFSHFRADNAIAETLAPSGPSITGASNITNETQPATITLANNENAPTAVQINGEAGSNIAFVSEDTEAGTETYSYLPPLIADDAEAELSVSVDGDNLTTTISYANSYDRDQLTHPATEAEYSTNSLSYPNAYGTSLPYEWKVITDASATVVVIDWDALEADDGFFKDIAGYATPVANGSTTVTLGVFVPETGEAYQFDRTINVSDGSVVVEGQGLWRELFRDPTEELFTELFR